MREYHRKMFFERQGLIEVKGCIITIDAMACQTGIAEKSLKNKPIMSSRKGSQKHLYGAITDYFEAAIATNKPELCQLQTFVETDVGPGRIETRWCYICTLTTVKLFAHAARAHDTYGA